MRHLLRKSVFSTFLLAAGSSLVVAQQTAAPVSDPAIAVADSLQKNGQHDAALRAYEAVAARHSQEAAYWNAVGASASDAKQYATGAAAFEKSAAISPNPIAMYNAAAMHARLGHSDQAFDWLHNPSRPDTCQTFSPPMMISHRSEVIRDFPVFSPRHEMR
jgi:hypothetical protein